MALIKCKKCGKESADDARYCTHCGHPIKSKKNIIKISILIFFFITLFGICLIRYLNINRNENNNMYGNEIFNLTSYTDNFIQYGDWIIFSNGVSEVQNIRVSNFEEGIYKYNIQTGQVIRLSKGDGICFNIMKNRLYYINKFNTICFIDLETLKSDSISWINGENYNATDLLICDSHLYYREKNGQNIYRTNSSGSNKDLIVEYTEGNFQIYDNFIYYIDVASSNLKKKTCSSSDLPTQLIDEKISSFYYKNNGIIYTVGNELKVFNMQDNSKVTLKKDITSNFVINDSYIYMYSSKTKCIIRLNIEDKSEEIIVKNVKNDIYRLQIYINNLYYSNRQVNGLWSPYATTSLYRINLNNKEQQKFQFKTEI